MSNQDTLSYSRTASGALAVYLGNRRIGTIIYIREHDRYAYVPAGLSTHAGEMFMSEDAVKDSLYGDGDGF